MKIFDTPRSRRITGAATAAVAIAALTACGSSGGDTPGADEASGPVVELDTADWDALVEQANEEGEVSLYWSLGEKVNAPTMWAEFEKQYPDIDVNVTFLATGDLISRVSEEFEAGAAGADVVIHASPTWFADADAAGSFAPLELSPDNVEEGWTDLTGDKSYATYLGVQFILGYNTSQDEPAGIKEVLDDDPDAKIGLVDPHASSAAAFTYDELRKEYGDEVLDQLADSDYTIYASNSVLSAAFAAGEVQYAYPDLVRTTKPLAEKGAPIAQIVTTVAQTGADYNVAVPKTAPHSAAAQVFTNFLLSRSGQEAIAVDEAPGGTVPLEDIPNALAWDDIQFLNPDDWTTDKWNAWIAEYWTPRFG